jgi:arylformamidase
MIVTFQSGHKILKADFRIPLDISIPLRAGKHNVNAYYIPPVTMEPFRMGNFIGDVKLGGSCNVNSIFFNPHGNGTHTECVGHISREMYTINQCLKEFFFTAELITIAPENRGTDQIITRHQLIAGLKVEKPKAVIIRTLPNNVEKMNRQYSGANPPYLEADAAEYLASIDVKHLLLDVPSVDREDDGGKLLAHRAFWQYPKAPRLDCTITELIFVPEFIADGSYLLNIQIASFENDASPSKPVLYKWISS